MPPKATARDPHSGMRRAQRRHGERGFTLIELLIVVTIIAILAAILIPNFLRARAQSQLAAAKGNMKNAATALESYFVDNNAYPTSLGALSPNYIRGIPNDPCVGPNAPFAYSVTGTSPTTYTLSTSWTSAVACSGTLGVNGISYAPNTGLSQY